MVGYYTDGVGVHGFVYSVADGWATLDYPGAYSTELLNINSNGEILGWYATSNYSPFHYFLYYNGGFANLSPPAFNQGPFLFSLNDFADVVGEGQNAPPITLEGIFGQTEH